MSNTNLEWQSLSDNTPNDAESVLVYRTANSYVAKAIYDKSDNTFYDLTTKEVVERDYYNYFISEPKLPNFEDDYEDEVVEEPSLFDYCDNEF